jgi:D-alanyl-D-alanine carboxypeptidase/D-alanyl-D-alanine-endopeptidase (penicillin-binding protein 4)
MLFAHQVVGQFNMSKLENAFLDFEKDSQIQQANVSFCMINNSTGKIIFQKKKDMLLPPASTLKTFTTASALFTLGENFRYETKINFKGTIKGDVALGELIVYASGDPSFGSDRFNETKSEVVLSKISEALKSRGVKSLKGKITIVNPVFNDTASNIHWLEEDFGNYYGAGVYALNWKENKFDISIKTKKSSFEVVQNDGGLNNLKDFKMELVQNNLPTANDAFAYILQNSPYKYALRGDLATSKKVQNMSLARINPEEDFKKELIAYLKKSFSINYVPIDLPSPEINLITIQSPPLSKLVYWCNQKSLNLYAEAFCKTIALKKTGKGNWNSGLNEMKRVAQYWGVDTNMIHLFDASGLAPTNKITTYSIANLLSAYKKQAWSQVFFESLPIINGMTMKSGYIGGTRSYAGYITLHDSTNVSFAFIVNNYTGKPRSVKEKMFKVLDVLKP